VDDGGGHGDDDAEHGRAEAADPADLDLKVSEQSIQKSIGHLSFIILEKHSNDCLLKRSCNCFYLKSFRKVISRTS
jgi:hypothetical protein